MRTDVIRLLLQKARRAGLFPLPTTRVRERSVVTSIPEDDVKILRGHGFNDRAILDIVLVAGMFNLTNRIVLGLGRDLHQGMDGDAARLRISGWRSAHPSEGSD